MNIIYAHLTSATNYWTTIFMISVHVIGIMQNIMPFERQHQQ